jgi:MFS family permease
VGGLLLAEVVPAFLAPLLGAVADRVDRRRAMIVCELGQAAVYGLIALLLPPYAGLLVFVGVATLLSRTFSAASKSTIPALVERDELMSANALINTVFNLQVALGPALGGLLVAVSGSQTAIAVDAATFLVSALIMLRLPPIPPAGDGGAETSLLEETREGMAYLWRDRLLRTLALSMFAFVLFASFDNVAVVFLVKDTLGGTSFEFGAAMSAFGIGMILGAVGLVRGWSSARPAAVVAVGMLFTAAGNLLVGLAPAVGFVLAFQLVGGVGNGLGLVGEDTLIQRHVPPHLLGRVFGALATAIFLGNAVAYTLGSVFVDATSPRTALVVSGVAVFGVVALAWPVLRRASG